MATSGAFDLPHLHAATRRRAGVLGDISRGSRFYWLAVLLRNPGAVVGLVLLLCAAAPLSLSAQFTNFG